jgi:putative membrane protein
MATSTMRPQTASRSLRWLLTLSLAIAACGDDDDAASPDSGLGHGSGSGGAGSSGRVGSSAGRGGTSAKAGSGGFDAGVAGETGREERGGSGGVGERTTTGGSKAEPGTVAKLNDAEIASVVLTANQLAIQENMLAIPKAQRTPVRLLAQDFVDARTAAEARESGLFSGLGITPEDNIVTTQLRDASANVVSQVQTVDRELFDQTYLQTQVDALGRLVELIDDRLSRDVGNDALRGEIANLRADVQTQLARARALLTSVISDSDAGAPDAGL